MVGQACQAYAPEHARAASYSSYIWDEYEGCGSARAFKTRLRALIRSVLCDWLVIGGSARAYKTDIGRPTVDALIIGETF